MWDDDGIEVRYDRFACPICDRERGPFTVRHDTMRAVWRWSWRWPFFRRGWTPERVRIVCDSCGTTIITDPDRVRVQKVVP